MFYGMFVFLFAAVNRMGGGLSQLTGINTLFYIAPTSLFLISSSLFWYDWKSTGKIHPVTWIGFLLYWGSTFLARYLGDLESSKTLILSFF